MEEQRVQIPVKKCNKMEKEDEKKKTAQTQLLDRLLLLFFAVYVYT